MEKVKAILELRESLYAFCASLSIDETASNSLLLKSVEKLEREIARELIALCEL